MNCGRTQPVPIAFVADTIAHVNSVMGQDE
jgi:hypothetical protein